MSKKLTAMNPFRPKSALHAIFDTIAKHPQMDAEQVARKAKVPLGTTTRMIAALSNKYHNAGMRRAGIELVRKDGVLSFKTTKPDLHAVRPARGADAKKKAGKKTKAAPKNAKSKAKARPAAKKKSALKPTAVSAPVPAPEPAANSGDQTQ